MNEVTQRILVVDDDDDTLQNLSDILTDMGYEVAIANNGAAALDLVRQIPYDLALLDFKMPDMDGITLSRKIHELRAGTVSVIVTAFASEETAEQALQSGVWQVLSKPVDFSRLLSLVETAIEQPLIMVVDDDRELCENLWELLRDREFRACLAHDVEEARQRFQERDYELVLIDLKMPQGDGTEVLKTIQESNPTTRTILITGYRTEMQDLIDQSLQSEADAVCYKPFDIPILLKTIENLTRKGD